MQKVVTGLLLVELPSTLPTLYDLLTSQDNINFDFHGLYFDEIDASQIQERESIYLHHNELTILSLVTILSTEYFFLLLKAVILKYAFDIRKTK